MKRHVLTLALAALLVLQPSAQTEGANTPTAEDLWHATVHASRGGSRAAAPIDAFYLYVDLLTREGQGTNQAKVALAYRAPHAIRFAAGDGREMGRSGPAPRDHWLLSGERVVVLEGRDYEEDRRQIRTMHALARNFIALSDPSRLEVTEVERLEDEPDGLPKKLRRVARKLDWIRLRSPDFALGSSESGARADGEGFVVEFGLAREGEQAALPILALIHDAARDGRRLPPMLLHLEKYAERDGFRVPHRILVHHLEARTDDGQPSGFQELPGKEIYLLERSSLRPRFRGDPFQRPEPR